MKISCACPDLSTRTVTVYLKNITCGKEKATSHEYTKEYLKYQR